MGHRAWVSMPALYAVFCGSAVALGGLALAWAAGGVIYSCVDANGKRLTSDRP
ncbi:DUF4124 domain-containing protein, partial [Piscinibacter sp.]|uniref:DUF4124 domain-containing protein n=1 Tax=Piscinibacter sp. TaxID=1903157 RepID=UPI0035597FA6